MVLQDKVAVLVVSACKDLQTSLQDKLKVAGFNVSVSNDCESALQSIQHNKPGLTIVDLNEPLDFAEDIVREISSNNIDIPVIVLSDARQIEKIEASLQLGAMDYLIKPVSDPTLVKLTVMNAIEKNRLLSENRRYRQQLESSNLELNQTIKKLKDDQEAGRFVQEKLFPSSPARYYGCDLEFQVVPSSYLSGDFVDYFRLDDHRFVFYLADVSGHGSASAFITLFLKVSTTEHLRNFKKHNIDIVAKPAQILNWFNQELIQLDLGKHLTMFYGVVDTRKNTLNYSIAAHFPLPVLVNKGKINVIESSTLPIGVFADAVYEDVCITLSEQFSLIMLSDGIIEVLTQATLLDKEQYLLGLIETGSTQFSTLANTLNLDRIDSAPDDIALMVVNRS